MPGGGAFDALQVGEIVPSAVGSLHDEAARTREFRVVPNLPGRIETETISISTAEDRAKELEKGSDGNFFDPNADLGISVGMELQSLDHDGSVFSLQTRALAVPSRETYNFSSPNSSSRPIIFKT